MAEFMKKLMLPVSIPVDRVPVRDGPGILEEYDQSTYEEEIQGNEDDECADGNVLDIVGNDLLCRYLGIEKLPGQTNVKFLLRSEYLRIWDSIITQYPDDTKFLVTGTAGIGKSAFRYFILREWLLKDDGFGFESVVFNVYENYFRVMKDGSVSGYVQDMDLDLMSMCLFDPCSGIDGQGEFFFGLAIVTTSPSALTKVTGRFNLRAYSRLSKLFVMDAWRESEIRKVSPNVDNDRLVQFSSLRNEIRYCIPSWLIYKDKSKVQEELYNSCTDISTKALARFVRTNRANYVCDSEIPYRLCRIEYIPRVGWAATDFISVYVAKYVYRWVQENLEQERLNFIELLQNPFSHGLFDDIFVDWVSQSLGQKGRELVISGNTPLTFKFKGIQSFSWNRGKQGVVINPVRFVNGIFFKPEGLRCPSIDGYSLHGDHLLLFQSTVAQSQSQATYTAVSGIIRAARRMLPRLQILIVYIVPQNVKPHFTAPICETLVKQGAKVVVGVVSEETDLISDFENEINKE